MRATLRAEPEATLVQVSYLRMDELFTWLLRLSFKEVEVQGSAIFIVHLRSTPGKFEFFSINLLPPLGQGWEKVSPDLVFICKGKFLPCSGGALC